MAAHVLWHWCENLVLHNGDKGSSERDATHFMLGWLCLSNYMNNNQLDALFIFSWLSYHTSTCCGRISSPSSAGRMYICGKWCLLYFWINCQRALPEWKLVPFQPGLLKSPEYGVRPRTLKPYSGDLNYCLNCIPASEAGLKESSKYVRQK
jgi:hypothetical protein